LSRWVFFDRIYRINGILIFGIYESDFARLFGRFDDGECVGGAGGGGV
jgi:hypothetical protein